MQPRFYAVISGFVDCSQDQNKEIRFGGTPNLVFDKEDRKFTLPSPFAVTSYLCFLNLTLLSIVMPSHMISLNGLRASRYPNLIVMGRSLSHGLEACNFNLCTSNIAPCFSSQYIWQCAIFWIHSFSWW